MTKKKQKKPKQTSSSLCNPVYHQKYIGIDTEGGGGVLRLTWKDNYITNYILFMRFSDKSIQFSMILFFRRNLISCRNLKTLSGMA